MTVLAVSVLTTKIFNDSSMPWMTSLALYVYYFVFEQL